MFITAKLYFIFWSKDPRTNLAQEQKFREFIFLNLLPEFPYKSRPLAPSSPKNEIQEHFACGIRNRGLWNPESLLTIEIQNPANNNIYLHFHLHR